MALRGIQEYIARDVNNIARVENQGYIVSIEGNIFLYPPKKSHPILLSLFICVCHLTILRSAAILSVYKQAEKSACQVRVCLK